MVVIILLILGAANDSANEKAEKERKSEPIAHSSVFHAGDAEYQYMRVPKF